MSTELTVEEIKRQVLEAMDLPDTIDWLEEVLRQLEAYRAHCDRQRRYDVSTIGRRIRTAREIVGLSQGQLAHQVGIHRWTFRGIEEGRRNMPLPLLPRLARLLSVSEAWLLMETDEGGPAMPGGVMRKQIRVNWRHASFRERKKAEARAELERLRGLRPPKVPRPHG